MTLALTAGMKPSGAFRTQNARRPHTSNNSNTTKLDYGSVKNRESPSTMASGGIGKAVLSVVKIGEMSSLAP